MLISRCSTLVYGCLAALLSLQSNGASTQETLVTPTISFRDMQSEDIPALTSVLIDAFSPGPIWHYLLPDLNGHEQQLWKCINARGTIEWESRNQNTTFARVITVDDKPVSFSIWNVLTQQEDVPHGYALSLATTPDCSMLHSKRGVDLDRQMSDIHNTYFQDTYPHQLYLNTIATHPSWDGHGFAARHLQWGKELSLQLPGSTWPITLLATPAGWPLYESTGFENVANVSVSMLDNLGELWFEVMRLNGTEQ